MGLFSFTQEIAMDLGTANTIILSNDKIVVDEPSVVALDRRTDKMIAVGERAKLMYEKENPNIRTVRPLRDGVIADFNACEQMMRGLIKKVNTGRRLFTPSLRMVIGVPSGSTEVELRAVRDSAEHAGGRDVYLIFEPMAAAIGIGLDVEAPEGNMIVDIGGGTTDVAIVSMNGIVTSHSIKVAGNTLDQAIIRYVQTKYKLLIGEHMAERAKIQLTNLFDPREDVTMYIKGRNLVSGMPEQIEISETEIFEAVEDEISDIIEAIKTVLEETPPELVGDIYEKGVLMAGGGAMLGGLRKLVEHTLKVRCVVAKDAMNCVAKGTAIAFKNIDNLLDGFENIAIYQYQA